jgi:hypothetical protein
MYNVSMAQDFEYLGHHILPIVGAVLVLWAAIAVLVVVTRRRR